MIGTAILSLMASAMTPTLTDPLFSSPKVPDAVLAEQRGGIRLPNGIDVALSVETRTALDGAIVLQTVVKIEDGPPVVTVYTAEEGELVELPARNVVSVRETATVIYDRQNGIQIISPRQNPVVSISSSGSNTSAEIPSGLKAVDITNPVQVGNGILSAIGEGARTGVELRSSDLQIVHLTGNAFGSVIANSGSNRIIDTQTTIGIDLHNAGPYVLGSLIFRVENIAIEAMSTRF